MASFDAGAPAIRTRGLQMRYGDNHVLRGIDLEIAAARYSFAGAERCGQDHDREILEGFRAPSAGEVEVLGVNPATADDAWRAQVGIVLQSWRDHAKWRVRELLDYLGDFYAPTRATFSDRGRSTTCWPRSDCPMTPIPRSPSSRADDDDGSTSRPDSSDGRSYCSWTSRRPASTRRAAAISMICSDRCPMWTHHRHDDPRPRRGRKGGLTHRRARRWWHHRRRLTRLTATPRIRQGRGQLVRRRSTVITRPMTRSNFCADGSPTPARTSNNSRCVATRWKTSISP